MPYEDPDATDPMMLHGTVFETEDDQALREMTECFIEEYMRLGFSPDRVLKMFATPGYAGPYMAYQSLGEQTIKTLINEYAQRFGSRPPRQTVDRNTNGDVMLPVLEQ